MLFDASDEYMAVMLVSVGVSVGLGLSTVCVYDHRAVHRACGSGPP